jgi:hypothetical protein
MPVIKNTPRYLDLDKDLRIVDAMSMPYALNVGGVYNEGSDYFVLKNRKGTVAIPFTLPNGISTVVGTVKDDDNNALYYFVHNSLGNHTILRYNSNQKDITKILQSSKLNFRKEHVVQGYAIGGLNQGDILVYFTDGFNPPRKINIKKAIAQTSGDVQNGYGPSFEADFDLYLDQVKHPPVYSPTFEFVRIDGVGYNNISSNSFQFRYRYIYDDGEISAFSPYSELAVQYEQINNSFFSDNVLSYSKNAINVFINNGGYSVKKIEVAFRNGNDGELMLLDTIDNNPSQTTTTITFLNDGNYGAVSDRDVNKLFDAVPILAKTQAIKNNRNFWGNVYDTYPTLTGAEKSGGVSVIPRYLGVKDISSSILQFSTPNVNTIPLTAFGTISATTRAQLTNVLPLEPGITVVFEINTSYTYNPLFKPEVTESFRMFSQYEIQAGDTYSDIRLAIQNDIASRFDSFPNNLQSITTSLSTVGTDTYITFTFDFFRGIVAERETISVSVNSEFYEYGSAIGSFKSGASHPVGIVYYDRANRSSTVNKVDTSYVKFFSERAGDDEIGLERRGAAHLDWRINWTPPSWATHYQWVYAKNSTIDYFLQYTNLKAYADAGYIYLSMRSLLGEDFSYNEYYGGKLSYNFVSGDRIRLIKYRNPDTGVISYLAGNYDFKIVDFKYLDQDSATNPIYNSANADTKIETSGWFLIVENPGIQGFDNASNDSYWFNGLENNGIGAVWEIYRRKSSSELYTYYEVGEEYEILNAGQDTRVHAGQLRYQGEQISQGIFHIDLVDNQVTVTNEPKVVAGDVVAFTGVTGVPVGQYTVNRVFQNGENWEIYLNEQISISAGLPVLVVMYLVDTPACGILTNGDVWFKQRRLRFSNEPATSNYRADYVEDFSFNDFYSSKSISIGRANSYSPNEVSGIRPSTIVYSDPIQIGTTYNGLSSVYLSEAPFVDLDRVNNSIQKVYGLNESLIVYQENKVVNLPISRSIIETAEGGGMLVATTNVIGPVRYYAGDYGIGRNPESFAESDNKHYFADIKDGSILRLSTDGITPISQYGMDSFFQQKAREYSEDLGGVKVFGAFDVEYDEYVVSVNSETLSTLSINGAVSPFIVQGATEIDDIVTIGGLSIVGTDSFDQIAISEEPRSMSVSTDVLSESGYPIARLSTISETREVLVPSSVASSTVPVSGLVVFETEDDDILVPIELDVPNSEITILDDSVDIESTQAIGGFTLSYSEPANKWVSFWSYSPDYMADVSNEFVSFKNGSLYVHSRNEKRSFFYGIQYGSVVETVFNKEPSLVKVFHASSIESNKAWNGLFDTNINSSSIDNLSYDEREGSFYSNTPTAISSSTTSNLHGIGQISSITGNTLIVSGFNVNDSLISIGDQVFENTTSVGQITGFPTVSSISLSAVTGLSVGDYIYSIKNDSVDGDYLRGAYMKHRLSLVTEDEVQVYAVNAFVKESKLHHP